MTLRNHITALTAPRSVVAAALSALLLICLEACSPPGNEYAEYIDIPSSGWAFGESVTFTPAHPDSLVAGQLVIGVRHDNRYPYRSLWLEVTATDGSRLRRDTVNIHLADSYGTWTGVGIGTSFQNTDTIAPLYLHPSRTPVKIRHIMRADTLRGIEQLGIFFLPELQRR